MKQTVKETRWLGFRSAPSMDMGVVGRAVSRKGAALGGAWKMGWGDPQEGGSEGLPPRSSASCEGLVGETSSPPVSTCPCQTAAATGSTGQEPLSFCTVPAVRANLTELKPIPSKAS